MLAGVIMIRQNAIPILSSFLPAVAFMVAIAGIFSGSSLSQDFGSGSQGASFIEEPPPTFFGRPDSSLELIGRWGWGRCGGVASMGNYVLTSSGPRILWVDMSNSTHPVVVWDTAADYGVSRFVIRDSIGYALIGNYGLLVIDLRNPSAPFIAGHLAITAGLISFVVEGQLVFMKAAFGPIFCIDVSNPSSPFIRAGIPELFADLGKLVISGHDLYVGDPVWPLTHIDVSNPDSTRITTLWSFPGPAGAMYMRDTLLFMDNTTNLLRIYSISVPTSPVLLSSIDVGAPRVAGIATSGDTAYVTTSSGSIVVLDITVRTDPAIIGTYTPQTFHPSLSLFYLDVCDTILFAATDNGMSAFSVADPNAIRPLTFFPTGDVNRKVAVKNNLAYLTSGLGGLWVADLSDPLNPLEVGNLQTLRSTNDILVDSTIAYVTFLDGGLWTIDVSRPDSMRVLDTVMLSPTGAIAKQGPLVLVTHTTTAAETTVSILNVDDPQNIQRAGYIRGDGYTAREIVVRDSIAFVASNRGLKIYDFSSLTNPQILSSVLSSASGVSIEGNLACILRLDSTFVVDLSILASPVILSRVRHPPPSSEGRAETLMKAGYFFWALAGEFGIIDVRNPFAPRVIFEVENFSGGGIDVIGDIVCITRGDGVLMYRFDPGTTTVAERSADLGGFHLFQNYPNPFNPSTSFNFDVPEPSRVSLVIYDVLGREVARLADSWYETGYHSAQWNGNNIASGVYFARFTATDIQGSIRLAKVIKAVLAK